MAAYEGHTPDDTRGGGPRGLEREKQGSSSRSESSQLPPHPQRSQAALRRNDWWSFKADSCKPLRGGKHSTLVDKLNDAGRTTPWPGGLTASFLARVHLHQVVQFGGTHGAFFTVAMAC